MGVLECTVRCELFARAHYVCSHICLVYRGCRVVAVCPCDTRRIPEDCSLRLCRIAIGILV